MTTGMSDILIYLSLALVVLWTARLARTKGRNPLLWGSAALALMLIPSWPALLGMAPMIILLLMKSPQVARQDVQQDTVNCPKCRAVHAAGHTYCVNCGWELAKPYSEDSFREEPLRVPEESGGTPRSNDQPSPGSQPAAPAPRPVESPHSTAEVLPVSAPSPPAAGTPAAEAPSVEPPDAEPPAQETPPAPQPVFRGPLTAAAFTERGLALFNQGKFQEAIDQFTKAIALDPKYVPAWTRRSEAYVRLGRKNKAEEDRRHLDGLQGQAPG